MNNASPDQRPRLGLIGLGHFGAFAARHLRAIFDVVGYDSGIPGAAEELGITHGNLREAAECPVVVLAVPVQELPGTLAAIAPHVQEGTLVADVASVKKAPVQWMLELLPEHVEVVGTHPLFGPRSAAAGIAGHRVVVCPARTGRLESVRSTLEGLGLEVIVTDADTHDRHAAYKQALAQYVGRALRGIDEIHGDALSTPAADRLRQVAAIVGEDSWELFTAIETLNPYAGEMRRRLRRSLDELDARLAEEAG